MRKFSSVIVILILSGLAAAGLLDSNNSGDLFISADYACFSYSGEADVSYAEIYYSLLRNQLAFQPDSVGYYAMLNMFIEIKSEAGELIDSSAWTVGNWIGSIADSEIPNYMINDIVKAQLLPGRYDVTIKARDVNSSKSGLVMLNLDVPEFPAEQLTLSQVELVYSVGQADGGHFDKGGKKLIPNTRSVYSHDDNLLYFYAEIYNLDQSQTGYSIDIQILDATGNIYKELPPMTQDVGARSEIIMNGFNIIAFKLGSYRLRLKATCGDDSAYIEKSFEITPGKLEWELAREKRELADFPEAEEITTEEEAKNFRNQILYIANRDELKQYDELPLSAKTRFAEAFWKRRDSKPSTPINEYKIEHYNRYRYANDAYSTFKAEDAKKNGWRSDRGRVHIVYGMPDDIENHPSSLDEIPWIQWFYNDVEGGAEFIFVDESGYGNYRLIHSSVRSEPKDYDWEQRITPSSTFR